MGAVDGVLESVTYLFERCLGWRGVLVEANPDIFNQLITNRPHALNLRVAACARHGYTNFAIQEAATTSSAAPSHNRTGAGTSFNPWTTSVVSSMCGPLGDYLRLLNVHSLDLFSLDVEGDELVVIDSLGLGTDLAVGVFLVEVRGDGQRPQLIRRMLERGFVYVGEIHARPSPSNEVVDDVFINVTHIRHRFPHSQILADAVGSSHTSPHGVTGGSSASRPKVQMLSELQQTIHQIRKIKAGPGAKMKRGTLQPSAQRLISERARLERERERTMGARY